MPRCAREKSLDSVYHVMVRSIAEINLFTDHADKDVYMRLLKRYKDIYLFKVYGFCLMETHGHIIIDVQGADISRIMHGVNQSYAWYYNHRHKRHGHLFQDRFKSKIVSDDRYLITLSAYIHNNTQDIEGYENQVEKYEYSSLGIYLGSMENKYGLVDKEFILSQISYNTAIAKKQYLELVYRDNPDIIPDDAEFKNEKAQYRSERKVIVRSFRPDEVVSFVENYIKQYNTNISIKYTKKNIEAKALSVLLLRGICDMKQKDICAFMGNITQSHSAKLCARGIDLLQRKKEYMNIAKDFIRRKAG
ncbi:transposase IS200 like protein [Oxobacter pfennigii]|uniref:Transposase IS200 like protein n=1 Tax=Oxobacter pfennigii TaxID=36849 RepID=A0A0P8Y9Q3_9CLOT|nr:transposase [Oxobacter pfennigii]KPU43618.1 transposase IS200 like protein [Oxobacter pfennigii]